MSAWAAFWIFLAVFYVCEAWLYNGGRDTFLFEHQSPEEKELQRIAIERRKATNA